MSFLKSHPGKTTFLDVTKIFPDSCKLLFAYHDAVMRGPSPLSHGERELLAAYVSRINECDYCVGVHAACAEQFGVDKRLLTDLPSSAEGTGVNAKMRAIFQFVRKLNEAPGRVRQADANALYAAGWDEQALYSIVSVCALFNLFNRLIDGLGIEGDSAYFKAAAERAVKAVTKQ